MFLDSTAVSITSTDPAYVVRYTIDGTDPVLNSSVYDGPIRLASSARVRARSFFHGRPVSTVAEASFTKVLAGPSVHPTSSLPGLAYSYYEGEWDAIPDFAQLKPVATGTVETLNLGMKKKDEYYGVRFSGYINIPSTAVYQFTLGSDDGSRLIVDGKAVIDNDGLHSTIEKSAYVPLEEGAHAMEVLYFNKTGDATLDLKVGKNGEAAIDVSKFGLRH